MMRMSACRQRMTAAEESDEGDDDDEDDDVRIPFRLSNCIACISCDQIEICVSLFVL